MLHGTVTKIIYIYKSCKSKLRKKRHKENLAKARLLIAENQTNKVKIVIDPPNQPPINISHLRNYLV